MDEENSEGNWKQARGILGGRPHFQILYGDEGGEGIGESKIPETSYGVK